VLAKEAEEVLLYRDMQSEAVQQLLRRLSAVKRLDAVPPDAERPIAP
jgi:LPS-assembly lipoprotein